MTLKKWIKHLDPITNIVIWTQDCDDNEPAWSGFLLDMPWIYLACEIGRPNSDDDEPIYISKNENNTPIIVINLIAK